MSFGSLAPTRGADGVHAMKSFRPGFPSHRSSFFPSIRAALLAGVAIAGLLTGSAALSAQTAAQTDTPAAQQSLPAVSAPGVQLPATKAEKKKAEQDAKARATREDPVARLMDDLHGGSESMEDARARVEAARAAALREVGE